MRKIRSEYWTLVHFLRASERGHRITFLYTKPGEETRTRHIEPTDAKVSQDGNISIVGRDLDEDNIEKSFRLDRLSGYVIHSRSAKFEVIGHEEQTTPMELSDDLGPMDVMDLITGKLMDQADRADSHGNAPLADLLWESAFDLEWASRPMALAA
jgi:predicted DNA-binding transcriptional regulator YafY